MCAFCFVCVLFWKGLLSSFVLEGFAVCFLVVFFLLSISFFKCVCFFEGGSVFGLFGWLGLFCLVWLGRLFVLGLGMFLRLTRGVSAALNR